MYLDISFYNELSTKYGAKGDFAMAYVIAHEVGHHIQNELGIMDNYASARQGKSKAKANQLNVKLELQADYYAGAWANYVQGQGLLEKGDIEEAMAAAHAVGDDTLQEETYGRTVLIVLHMALLSNANVGLTEVTNMATLSMVIPLASRIVSFREMVTY